MKMDSKIVVIMSGGMDSVILAYLLKANGYDLITLTANYGQRHQKEILAAKHIASQLGVEHRVVDLTSVGQMLKGSALTDNVPVPDGHYTDQSMRSTVVPNRNAILLSVAAGIAIAERANAVAIGVHAGDHTIYRDCRRPFIDAMESAFQQGNEHSLIIYAPFIDLTKADIVKIGTDLQVPFQDTWSCYKGGAQHCGKCGTCVERIESFQLAGIIDPTLYDSSEWSI